MTTDADKPTGDHVARFRKDYEMTGHGRSKDVADLIEQQEKKIAGLEKQVYELTGMVDATKRDLAAANACRDWSEQMRSDLFNYLDGLDITSDNIADIRKSLCLPFDCKWNAIVRDQTAAREVAIAAKEKP